eukprot:COSAG02_NODE_45003_length_361_cov_0.656489_1_plen_34_part_10
MRRSAGNGGARGVVALHVSHLHVLDDVCEAQAKL